MGCGPSSSTTIEPTNHKYPIRSFKQRKVVNSDQIIEDITITSHKLNPNQITFAVTTLKKHQLFGTLNKK